MVTENNNQPRVLITTPELNRIGGVAGFYKILRDQFDNNIFYFYIGNRNEKSLIHMIFRLLMDYTRFARLVYTDKFQIIHLNPSLGIRAILRDAIFNFIAKIFHKKTIVFIHGWNKNFEKILKSRCKYLFKLAYNNVDLFIVLAKDFQFGLRSMGYKGPIKILSTPYDPILLSEGRRYRSRNNANEQFNILFLSRIEQMKGIFIALESFSILKSTCPNVYMTVAGTGTALDQVREYVVKHALHSVKFTGYVEGHHKAEVFSEAHCYFFPSFSEGMPLTVAEAMAFGLPVVTRPVGALADFFVDGEMGFVTESINPTIFAKFVERLVNSPELCQKMSQRNFEYAQNHFSASRIAAKLSAIYRDVAADNLKFLQTRSSESDI